MNKTVLVVEDEKPLLNAISKKLARTGFHVLQARSVNEALKHIDEFKDKIDAIWLDHYLLGDKSGLDLVTILKTEKVALESIPIFVVSNTATPDKMKSYLELQINSYHTKADVRLDSVIDEIKSSLDKR